MSSWCDSEVYQLQKQIDYVRQQELGFFEADPIISEWLVDLLKGRDWLKAGAILKEIGLPDSDSARRRLHATAEASKGRIAGGQQGYKLVAEMKQEEFYHFRDWMLSQAKAMQRRICQADKVWYNRQAVPS